VYTPPRATHTLGNWSGQTEVKIDQGPLYASKDFWDPIKSRRINWGWSMAIDFAPIMATQSLPRAVTWHPELQQLVYSPLDEQDELRTAKLAVVSNVALAPNQTLPLRLPWGVGRQAEVEVSFTLPSTTARLGVVVMSGTDAAASGTLLYIDYVPPTVEQTAMANGISGSGTPYTVSVGARPLSNATAEPVTDTLKLSTSDTSLTIRVYVDHTFSEAYWMSGRVAMTVPTPSTDKAGMAAYASAPATLERAEAYSVGSIWVTEEQVRAAPRKDGKPIVGW